MGKGKAYLCVLLAAATWGTIGFFVKTLTAAGFTEAQLIAFRSWISAAVLVCFLLITDRSLLRIRLRDAWMFVGTGIISFTLFGACYFVSLQLTSLSTAAILLYTSPIFVTVFSVWLFHEKFTGRMAAALLMAFTGCVLVCGFSETDSVAGIVLGILSGLFYALYSIFGKFALRRYHPLTVVTYTFVFASCGIVPFCEPARMAHAGWSPAVTFTLLFFAAASGALAYLLYTKGLSGLPAPVAAVIAIVEPVVAALTGVFAFGERLSFVSVAGISLVLLAILVLSLTPSSRKKVHCD